MQKLSNQASWKPWQGAILQVIYVLLLIFAGGYMQGHWGMMGLLATEIMFLAVAIIVALVHKTPLKEVFPIKKISFGEFWGIVFFSVGAIMINMVCIGISACIFPNELKEAAALSEFMNEGLPFIPFLLIVAVSPAICEEAIMRGALLSHFRGLKKDWLIALIVGVCFGILHLSFLRFLSTAMLGFLLAYLVVKKNNILLPALLHFINNSFSAVVSYISQKSHLIDSQTAASALESVKPSQLLGTYMFTAFLAPIFMVLGFLLLKLAKVNWKTWLVASIMSMVMFISGLGLLMMSSLGRERVLMSTVTYEATDDEPVKIDSDIEEDGTFQYAVSGVVEKGSIHYEYVNKEDGTVIFSGDGSKMITASEFVDIPKGNYEFIITTDEDAHGSKVTVAIQMYKSK